MQNTIWITLANNAALLLALFVIYEISYLLSEKPHTQNFLSGILISAICLAVMSIPFHLSSGVIFDTRSIVISVSAMVFGPIPAIIAAFSAIVYRIIIGGAGTIPGIATILSSLIIGLLWRRRFINVTEKKRPITALMMSLIAHFTMLCSSPAKISELSSNKSDSPPGAADLPNHLSHLKYITYPAK